MQFDGLVGEVNVVDTDAGYQNECPGGRSIIPAIDGSSVSLGLMHLLCKFLTDYQLRVAERVWNSVPMAE
jgi:hypothetical protein